MTQSPQKPGVQAFEMHAPDLYNHDAIAPKLDGFDAVTDEQVAFFHEHGYLAIENAFTPEQTAAAKQGMLDLIMGRNETFKELQFEQSVEGKVDELTPEQRQDAVRKLMHFVDHEPRLKAMSADARLLDVLRRLMGDREPRLFQDMGLIKPPQIGREKPWHQDCAYFDILAGTPVVGVWIALDSATLENGCMRVLDGGHREGPMIHWKRRDWQICDTDIYAKHNEPYQSVAAPLEPGGLLLFDGLLPHGTPHNNSAQRRRAVQYHYCPADAEWTDEAARLALFGSEGKDVEC